jgi:hypothetical protein
MAHFAKINNDKKVIAVLTLNNSDMLNTSGVEEELIGQQYLEKHNNWPAQMWVQTSYNTQGGKHSKGGTPFRGNYAGIGYTWDENDQIFWPKKPFTSWVKHIPTLSWKSPIGDVPTLTEEQIAQNTADTHKWSYSWNEENQSWNLVNLKSS